jgi:hypothetical protein
MKSFGRYDAYVGVVTNYRLIIARLTNQMINESMTMSRNEAKAQGRGYLGQISRQMSEYSSGYTTRFLSMSPSSILSETPENFELGNGSISEIRIRFSRSSQDEDCVKNEFDVEIFSGVAKHEFRTDENEDYVSLLRSIYGERIRRR